MIRASEGPRVSSLFRAFDEIAHNVRIDTLAVDEHFRDCLHDSVCDESE